MEGHRIGRWVLVERLGEGSTATTWRATDGEAAGARDAVLKILRPERVAESPWLAECLRAEVAAADGSPGLARALEHVTAVVDGVDVHVAVFENAGPESLRDVMARGPADEALVRRAGARVAQGLATLHARGLVHGDVKPENVRLGESGACLVDLGLAQPAGRPHAWLRPGETAGTPAYAAPEQLEGAPPAPEADVHALGVTLYELVTGQHPFEAARAPRASRRALAAWAVRPEVSPALADVLRDMLAAEPSDRPPAAVVARLLAGSGDATWRSPEQERRAATLRALAALGARHDAELVGRDEELGVLLEAHEAARSGRGPRAVLVRGAGGHGKSRLAHELVTRAAEGGQAEILAGQARAEGEDPLSEALARRFARPELEEKLVTLAGLEPGLAATAARSAHREPGATLAAAELVPLLATLVERMAASRPLVVVLDDAHQAPVASWRGIAQLASAASAARLLVVVLARDEAPPAVRPQLADRASVRSLEVGPLGPEAARRLVAAALDGSGLPARVAEAVLEKAAGNPLLALRYAAAVRAGRGDAAELAGTLVDAAGVGVSADDGAVLEALAVAGDGASPALLAAMTGQGVPSVLRRLAALEWGPGLVVAGASGYRFEHQLLRDAFASAVPDGARRELHRRAAIALEDAGARIADARAGVLAIVLHRLEAGDPAGAVPFALQAMREAASRHAWDTAIRVARACAPEAAAHEPGLATRLRLDEATMLRHAGRPEEREAPLREALELATRAGLDRERLRAELELANAPAGYRPAEEVRPAVEALEDRVRAAGDQDLFADLARMLGILRFRCGDRRGAEALYREGLAAVRAIGAQDERAGGFLGNLGVSAANDGRVDEARSLYLEQLEEMRRTGHALWEARALLNLASASHRQGRLVEAIEYSHRCREAALRRGDSVVELVVLFNLGQYQLDLGRIADALAVATEIERSVAGSPKLRRHQALRLRAAAAGAEKRHAEALEMVEEAIGTLADTGQEDAATALELEAAGYLADLGRTDEARRRVEHALARPGVDPNALVEGRALLVRLGALPVEEGIPPDDAEPRLRVAAWLLIHQATGDREAARAAERIVTEMAALLPVEAREDFWRDWYLARGVREALARGG